MANKKLGYIKLYRSVQENWIWKCSEPFDRRSAWIDLLLLVNHREEKVPIGTHVQVIKPGQRWLSYKWLGSRWGWSYHKVLRFMAQLVSDGMVYVDGTPNGTLLTVVNWGFFNSQRITDGTTDEPTDGTTDGLTPITPGGTPGGIQTRSIRMNNNDKELEEKKSRPPCPGEEYKWSDYLGRWIPKQAGGVEWQ
jgi:hypothetical protein